MADSTLKNKYYVKKKSSDSYTDIATKFNGVRILSVDGFGEQGEAVNIYTAQWIDSQAEDFFVAKKQTVNNEQVDVVIRKNVDLNVTLIISRRYLTSTVQNYDEMSTYKSVIDYMCKHGDFYIKSAYTNMEAHVICLQAVKPTTMKLHRGTKSYILVTIPLHTLDAPTTISQNS